MAQGKYISKSSSWYKASVLLLSLLFTLSAVAANETLKLSEKEQAWINAHPQLSVANETDWPPFDYVENGQPAGYSIDVIRLISQKAGFQIKFINGYSWKELMQQFQAGKIDIMPALYLDDERRRYTLFSKSYYSQPSVMVVHKNNKDISNIKNLAGKRVAGIKGFSITSTIESIIPDVKIVPVKNILEGLKSVSLGNADAMIDSIGTVSYTLEENYIPNVRVIGKVEHADLANPPLHIGVAKDQVILRGIIDKALASINRNEKQKIASRWFHIASVETKQALGSKLNLSSAQQAWLKQQTKIRIGIMNAWPPMDYVDRNGKPAGIGVNLIDALNERLNNKLMIVPGLWKENLDAVKEKRLDALMDITPRPDREEFVHFTKPYIDVPHLIYTREGEPPVLSLADLERKTVGVEKGFFIVNVLQEKYPKVKVKEYRTSNDALDALSKAEVDAYVGNRAVANYIIENEVINNVIAQGKIKETSSINAIGVRKDREILRDILQKGLDDISPAERSNIINPDSQNQQISDLQLKLFKKLTQAERAWLDKKQTIRLGVDSGWPPVEWIDEAGNYQGMTSDYMNSMADMLGLKITKPEKMVWKEVMQRAKRKEIDVLTAVVSTEKRRQFLNFTTPYLNFPFVIFTRDDSPLVTDIHDIYEKRVGIEEGYSSQEKLKRDHPKLNLIAYKSTADILHALSVGKVDAYVGNLTVAVYLINKEGLTNIKVAAPTKYSFDISLGVRKDMPELHSILEKTLSMFDDVQRNEIRQRWLKLNYNVGVGYALVIKMAVVTLIVILLILLWNFIVQGQKKALSIAKAETDKANAKLRELDQLKSMFIASVSHELRTPLNAVIGFSSVMMNGLFGELSEKYQDYSVRINKSGQHLLSLITDIIDISKIESGNHDVEISDFELDEIMDEAVSSLRQQADSKGMTLIVNVPKGITLHTDKRRLLQCILNFISNAVKYSEKGEIEVLAKDNGDSVTCTVNDTGIGISKENMDKLFEPFERFESSIKIKEGGTGLGLYLTNKIVKDMLRGEIGAESIIGVGSSFWVKVPKVLETDNVAEEK